MWDVLECYFKNFNALGNLEPLWKGFVDCQDRPYKVLLNSLLLTSLVLRYVRKLQSAGIC